MKNIRLMIRVENYEKYREKLEKGPYIRQMDLAIFCSQILYQSTTEMQTRQVTWEMLCEWDISPEKLFQKAGEDSRKYLPTTIQTLESILKAYIKQGFIDQGVDDMIQAEKMAEEDYIRMFGVTEKEARPIYVVSNSAQIYGASVVFYENALKGLAKEKESNLILIPSSIHEWLVMTEADAGNLDVLESIVQDANRLVVQENEVLSNHVYRYSIKKDQIEMLDLLHDEGGDTTSRKIDESM